MLHGRHRIVPSCDRGALARDPFFPARGRALPVRGRAFLARDPCASCSRRASPVPDPDASSISLAHFVAVRIRSWLALRPGSRLRLSHCTSDRTRARGAKLGTASKSAATIHALISQHQYISLTHALFLSLFPELFGAAGAFPDSPRCCSSLPTTRTLNKIPRDSIVCRISSSCTGVICCGLCATSRRTRSSSSNTAASPESPCSNAVCRYMRFSSSKSSARRRSPKCSLAFGWRSAAPR